ncbi:hypothetical protein DFP72DRAFT_1144904 [Ephemerocybe angulata]|uniref:Uncharacterized protein n=1 Tax=Ephemerocybe angulata TaxID=980116 RepID=A0A8H6IEA4_9AGAR|nr:hypothetical protein DFP72DRAFT_1144904 [Tulosesus angulatus]
MPAPFSRLQLAAALIEYDNDPEDSEGKNRSAQESAIFAHFRSNPAARPDLHKRHSSQSNHLGVALPQDSAGQDGRGSAFGKRSRNSRSSLALQNPFGADSLDDDDEPEEEEHETELEVDLSSWGLDQFIPKEKNTNRRESRGTVRSRTISGGPNEFGEIPAAMAQTKSLNSLGIRQSTSSRLELTEDSTTQYTNQRRRAASQSTFPPSAMGEGSGGRRSPGYDQIGSSHHPRSQSRASIGSRPLMDEPRDDDDERHRTLSQGTQMTLEPLQDNPFTLQPPSQTSRFDPKGISAPPPVHARTISHGSMGSRGLLDNFDAGSTKSHESGGRDRPYSVVELLRPKVLVMPSPLQPVGPQTDEAPGREGFQLSRDGPPLPPGARPMSRRLSSNLGSVPIPSNSFIPNPTADLSYAQKVFRNTLAAGSAAGFETEAALPRATEDGEQIEFEAPSAPQVPEEEQIFGHGQPKPGRPTGKLFGKSLIDDLEQRKQQMRNKKRVFTGDQRPSMMARDSNRTSTLIDPTTLNERPGTNRQSSYGSQGSQNMLGRRNSAFKPLLNFEGDAKVAATGLSPPGADRLPKNRSVFGVDTLWEQEMVKLRAIQEQERIDEEERRKNEAEEARKKVDTKKKLRKKSRKPREEELEPDAAEDGEENHHLGVEVEAKPRVSIEPPVLPDIKPTVRRTMPPPADDDSSDEDDSEEDPVAPPLVEATRAWHSDSEEEEGPRRTTGVGLRNPSQAKRVVQRRRQDSDSDEDLPLTVAMQRVATRSTKQASNLDDSDEDEDKPLAQVLREPKAKSTMLDINFDRRPGGDSEEEDSQPLGLRASRAMLNSRGGEEEDDKPLAFHPEQQRRTQYQMFAAAQQQQQQQQQAMMMQAQFTNSMFFNQPMVPSPFFAPAMNPMMNPMAMMQPPMPIPSPPPIHDESKFVSVDRWRRDVAIDGER